MARDLLPAFASFAAALLLMAVIPRAAARLAGARDAETIGRWIGDAERKRDGNETLVGFGHAFLALALGDLQTASSRLERVLPRVSTLGGSRAQNTLFEEIHRFARDPAPYSNVALAA